MIISYFAVSLTALILQSLIASQLLNVIDLMLAVTMDNIFDVLQGIFFVITGGLTMAFATLKNSQGRAVMQGMLVGNLVATPLLTVVGNGLYSGVAGCTGVGDPTKDFPQGEPSECTSDQLFLSMFYVMKAITWTVTLLSGMLGTNPNLAPFVAMFSTAMTGAELFWKAIFDLLYTLTNLANPVAADDMVKKIATAEMFLTYIAAAFGMLSMYSLKLHLDKIEDEKACKGMSDAQRNEYFFRKKLNQVEREKYGEFSEKERHFYKILAMEQRKKFIKLDKAGRHRYANMTEEEEYTIKKGMSQEELGKFNSLNWEERIFFKNLAEKKERNEFADMTSEARKKHTSSTAEERKAAISSASQSHFAMVPAFLGEKAVDARQFIRQKLSPSSADEEQAETGPLASCMNRGKLTPKHKELDEDQIACKQMTEVEREDYFLVKNMTTEQQQKYATPEARKEFYVVKRLNEEQQECYGKMTKEEQAFFLDVAIAIEQSKPSSDLPEDEAAIDRSRRIAEQRAFFAGLSPEARKAYMAASETERETIRNPKPSDGPSPSEEKSVKEEAEVNSMFSSAHLKGSTGLVGCIARSPVIHILTMVLRLENGITDKMQRMDMAERLKYHDDKCKNMTGEQLKQYNEENMTKDERFAYNKREEEKKNKGKSTAGMGGGAGGLLASVKAKVMSLRSSPKDKSKDLEGANSSGGTPVSSCWSSVGFAPKERRTAKALNESMEQEMVVVVDDNLKDSSVSESEIPLHIPEAVPGAGSAFLSSSATVSQDKTPSTPDTKLMKISGAGGERDWPQTPASALSVADTPAAATGTSDDGPSIARRGAALSGAQLQPRRLGGFEEAVEAQAQRATPMGNAAPAAIHESDAGTVVRGQIAPEELTIVLEQEKSKGLQ